MQPDPDQTPLSPAQQEVWFAFMRVMLRVSYEMNRDLQMNAGLSLNDFHVLNALADSPGERLRLTALAARIGWELSRASHCTQRMSDRGLVVRTPCETDRRATDVALTDLGRREVLAATPAHAAWVRTLFFDGLDPTLLTPLRTALEQIHEQVLQHGQLPAPGPPQRRFAT